MRWRNAVTWCACAWLSVSGATRPVLAQQSAGDVSLRSQIDSIVAPYLAAADFMRVVGVQRDSEAPLILPYGLASVELDVPHEPSDIFMIGSVSKQFTAAAILLLEDDGLLRTDDPVSKYLPAFAHGEAVTLEQLLTHTSGVADIFSLQRFGATAGQGGTFEEVIGDFSRTALTHPPGSTYAYSNGGYAVLAAIIEHVSGTTFGEYLDARIFKPLGMSSTSHDGPRPVAKRRVPGYDPWGQGYAADLARYLDDGVTVVTLSNIQSVARDEIRRLVAAAVFGESYSLPAQRTFAERPPASLAELVGVYSFGPALRYRSASRAADC